MLGNTHLLEQVVNGWSEVAQQTNAVATVTRAADAAKRHVVLKVDASYSSASVSGELTVLFGAAVVARKHIHGAGAIDLGTMGLRNPDLNEAVSASLAAGGAGIVGDVTMTGYNFEPEVVRHPAIPANPAA